MGEHVPELREIVVPSEAPLQRLDVFLVPHLPQYSRSRIAELISDGFVRVDGKVCRPSKKLRGGEVITIEAPPGAASPLEAVPMELQVLYEDEHLVIINKPAGLVMHPGAGTREPTLVHGLLHAYPELRDLEDHERPGIVHRLDKDTSGCLMVARNEAARRALIRLFAERAVQKQYYALVQGVPLEDEIVLETTIGRSLRHRTRMAVNVPHGRLAYTRAALVEAFGTCASALAVRIVTGRTHQIRVHLAYAGLPVLGDTTYGKAARELSKSVGAERQMLHAHRISFVHPVTGRNVSVTAPIPADIETVAARLRELGK